MRNRWLRGAPQTFEVAWRRSHAGKLLGAIWIVAVAARLMFIDQPYVDHWSWRQSDVAAVARNFYDGGFRFAYPQIDWAGNATGYVGTEFPILPFVAAICYKFAGIHEWIGRSQAVIFAGRSFMPDVPSLSLAIIGLCFFLRWTHDQKWTSFFAAAIAISLSILIKVTSIVIFAPLMYLPVAGIGDPGRREMKLVRSRDHRSRLQLLLFIAIAIVPSAIWYWHAYQIAERFYPHHFFGAGGVRIEGLQWYSNIARQTAISSLTPVLAIMALMGLFVAPRGKYGRLFDWWLAAMVLFVVVLGYGNRHRWYQLPLVPIAAAFAGAACTFFGSKISSRRAAIALSILLAGSFAILSYMYVRPLYESSAAQLRDAGLELNKITPSDALIVAADMGDPTIFYYSQRKGWHFLEEDGIYQGTPSDSQDAIVDLEKLRRRGATHVVFTTNTLWWLDYYPEFAQRLAQSAMVMAASKEFKIYKFDAGTK